MATRVIKAGGSSIEFALAPEPLHVEDLDTDLDNIFGNIDNSNIAAGAAIATSKLAQDQGIQTGHLANGAVTGPKLAVGATVDASQLNVTAPGGSFGPTEANVCVLAPMQVNGGVVLLMGTMAWTVLNTIAGPSTIITRIYRDAVSILGVEYNVVFPAGNFSVPLPTPACTDQPAPGNYVYKVTVQVFSGNASVVAATFQGSFSAVELR